MRADAQTPHFIAEDGDIDGFEIIAEEQNFYINEKGQFVIAFNEYEVGPGYIGTPSFVIPKDVTEGIK